MADSVCGAERMYTAATLARAAGVHERTIRRSCQRSEIEHVRIGNSIRIPESEVRRVLGIKGEAPTPAEPAGGE